MPDIIRAVVAVITWFSDHPGLIVPGIVFVLWVLSSLKRMGAAMTGNQAGPAVPPAVQQAPAPPFNPPQPQRLPAQSLAGSQSGTPRAAVQPPAVTRLEYAAKSGPPQRSGQTTQSGVAMDQLRIKSDKEAAVILQSTIDAAAAKAALAPVEPPDLIDVLGGGDRTRGAWISAVILSQALERPRSGRRAPRRPAGLSRIPNNY